MSKHTEQYETNIGNGDGSTDVERLENELDAANKKAKTYFEAMKRSCDDANKYRAQYEKLRESVLAIIDKANRDQAKVKVIYLEKILLDIDSHG